MRSACSGETCKHTIDPIEAILSSDTTTLLLLLYSKGSRRQCRGIHCYSYRTSKKGRVSMESLNCTLKQSIQLLPYPFNALYNKTHVFIARRICGSLPLHLCPLNSVLWALPQALQMKAKSDSRNHNKQAKPAAFRSACSDLFSAICPLSDSESEDCRRPQPHQQQPRSKFRLLIAGGYL